MFFRLCTYFSGNLVEFHSRNKEVLQTTRIWTQTKDLKPPWWSPHRDDQSGYMEHMIWSSTRMSWYFENASVCKTRGSGLESRRVQFSRIRPESESRFSPYLVSILWFMKMAMSSHLYICRSRPIVTSIRPNQSINNFFMFLSVRVNVALLLPWIHLLPLTHLHRR
jgi:hypothetical protein